MTFGIFFGIFVSQDGGYEKVFFLLLILFIHLTLFSSEDIDTQDNLAFFTGLRVSYADARVTFDDSDLDNSLIYMIFALEARVDVSDYLSLGVIAGYNINHFQNSLQVTSLPLSLEINQQRSSSMVFGLHLISEFFSSGDFSIAADGEFLYFKRFEQEVEINLDIVSGYSTIKHRFMQGTLNLILKYHGLDGIVLFAGPQLNLISGKLTVSEAIEVIESETALNHQQKNMFGLVGGATFEFAGIGKSVWRLIIFLNFPFPPRSFMLSRRDSWLKRPYCFFFTLL